MKIGRYRIEKLISKNRQVFFFIARDDREDSFFMRMASNVNGDDRLIDDWFTFYETLEITNFRYLPRVHAVDKDSGQLYTVFPYEKGALLRDANKLLPGQVEELLEAVRHLHKKGIIHGNICGDTIWIRENGEVLLFGAGEQTILEPESSLTKHSDFDQLFSVLEDYTTLDLRSFKGKTPASLEEFLKILRFPDEKHDLEEPEINHDHKKKPGLEEKEIEREQKPKPGLEEKEINPKQGPKEKERKLDRRKQLDMAPNPDVDSKEQVPDFRPNAPEVKKKNRSWLLWSTVIVLGLAISFLFNSKEDSTAKSGQEPIAETDIMHDINRPPEISLQQFSELFPGWQPIKQEIIRINDVYYTVLGIGQKTWDETGKVQIAVIGFDSHTKQWTKVWESSLFEGEPTLDAHSFIGDFFLLNPPNQNKGLLAFSIVSTSGFGINFTQAIEILENGQGQLSWRGNGTKLEKKDGRIIVYELGETYLSLENDKLIVKSTPRSESGTSKAVKARLLLNADGQVTAADKKEITLKTGQILSFIPENKEAKQNFDDGSINIYTNLWNKGKVMIINANLIIGGNAVKFEEKGTFEFVLDYDNVESEASLVEPEVTFVVHVID